MAETILFHELGDGEWYPQQDNEQTEQKRKLERGKEHEQGHEQLDISATHDCDAILAPGRVQIPETK
jgi:hypothetical protein